jgi:FkbM family methyltransferase
MKFKLRRRLNNIRKALAAGPGELGYHTEIGQFDGFEVAYRGGTADESVLKDSFANDIFYRGVPEYRPGPRDTILDIGAHIGTFALLSARLAPAGRIIAVEASRETFNYLRINAALNGFAHLKALHYAVADKRGTARLYYHRGNWGHSIMAPLSARGEEVPTIPLADVLSSEQIDRVDFIKFNCEGAEFPILMATPLDVLARIDRMLVLYHGDLSQAYTLEGLEQRLASAGFKCSRRNIEPNAPRGWLWAER